jgi:hypothetical protein
MSHRKKLTFVIFAFLLALLPSQFLYAGSHETAGTGPAPIFVPMPEPGKKVQIGNDNFMIYGFVEKPKMGSIIMKIQVFNKKGEKDRSLVITADSWMPSMPSMRGGQDTFKLSHNGDYLTPIHISMPGDWEIKFTISRHGKVIFRGSYKFDV